MTPTNRGYTLRNPQAVAWIVLLTGAVMFCVLCVVSTAGARWFLFDSEVSLTIRLTVSRGRVDLRLPDGTDIGVNRERFIDTPNAVMETDITSQGYLTFEDNYSRQVVATVYLLQDSSLTLRKSTGPRFDWGSNGHEIVLDSPGGRFYVQVEADSGRPLTVEIAAPTGGARLGGPGLARVEVSDRQVQMHVEAGQGTLRGRDGNSLLLEAGTLGAVRAPEDENGDQRVSVTQAPYQVLNARFGSLDDIDVNPALPVGWGCTSRANRQNEPQGSVARTYFDQQVVLRMLRAGEGLDHAESRCTYSFELAPRLSQDVSGYSSLAIRAWIRIHHQDVTTCGIRGSECPIMLELEYLAPGSDPDQPMFWRHGFYAIRPPTDDNPLSCDTCLQEHEKLNAGAWYIYDSGDLFRALPENRRPVRITQLSVYASGHAYDAVVGDLVVIAGLSDAR
jgi:hypothetical protein